MYFEKNIKSYQLTCCLNEHDIQVLLGLLDCYISYLKSTRLYILYPYAFNYLLEMKDCIEHHLEFQY